jgi:hypothetical protein
MGSNLEVDEEMEQRLLLTHKNQQRSTFGEGIATIFEVYIEEEELELERHLLIHKN